VTGVLDDAKKRRAHQLQLDSRALLESLADRLPEPQLRSARRASEAGERALLVDSICASLVKRQIPITEAEHVAIANLLVAFTAPRATFTYLNDPAGTLAKLNVDSGEAG
jgi:hypothetical protein